jgi:hypothetical protein
MAVDRALGGRIGAEQVATFPPTPTPADRLCRREWPEHAAHPDPHLVSQNPGRACRSALKTTPQIPQAVFG